MLVIPKRVVGVASSASKTGCASSQTDDRRRIRLGLRKLRLTHQLPVGLGRKEHVRRPDIGSETPSAMVSNVGNGIGETLAAAEGASTQYAVYRVHRFLSIVVVDNMID